VPSRDESFSQEPLAVEAGTLIAERYRVESTLGEGGMGIVYLAEHIHIRKRVALKVLLPRWTSTPEVVARFEREAVAAGAIDHPNVTAATDFGCLPDGSFFLVLEYIEGRTLRSEVEAGALSPDRALAITRGIALGIGAAHAKGIVHRDLKPENVMLLARDGDPDFVKVLDFGIARLEGFAGSSGQLVTSAGAVLGTPDYMAPEQILGSSVDARADLYALGIMLYEMLTGACPFKGGATTLLRQHVLNEVPSLPPDLARGVPEALRTLMGRLMQKEPGARFANAVELLAAIDAARAEMVATATTARAKTLVAESAPGGGSSRERAATGEAGRPRRRAGALVVGVAAVVIVTAIGLRSSSGRVVTTKVGADAVKPLPVATEASSTRSHLPPPAPSAGDAPATTTSAAPRKRRTGPGGIYVPPPSRWFR
jgi:hypothetical protein